MTLQTEIAPEHLSAWNIFNGDGLRKMLQVESGRTRFVHYTPAEVAFSILSNAEVWMRRPQLMNDFREIEWGFDCLVTAWRSGLGGRFSTALDNLFPGSADRMIGRFDSLLPMIRARTFMTCISEHDDDEDQIGRLSMWRAYGGHAGVAIVMNSTAFTSVSDALNAYTHPVSYHGTTEVASRLAEVLEQISQSENFLRLQGEEFVHGYVHELLNSIILCTKHPGFREEREWRVIHNTYPDRNANLQYRNTVIRGVPQQIVAVPLRDIPEEGLLGLGLSSLVDRVIIGPNEYAWETRDVMVAVLEQAGMTDAEARVWVSDIPVRQAI